MDLAKKISALFALADNNPSPEESRSALEQARKLLQEHNLTMIDVENAGSQKGSMGGYSETEKIGKKISTWRKSLASIVADYFDVKVINRVYFGDRKTSFLFYGLILNTEIAIQTFCSLQEQIILTVKRYSAKGRFAKDDYRNGILNGLNNRLSVLKSEQNAKCATLTICSEKISNDWIEEQGVILCEPPKKSEKKEKERERRKNVRLGFARAMHFSAGVYDSDSLVLEKALSDGTEETKKR